MTNKVPHNKHTRKYGTDDRYPYWKGGAIDPKTINGFTAIAIVLNWTAVIYAIRFPMNPDGENVGLLFSVFYGIAIAVCLATMFLIRHPDRTVRWFTRGFACGIPLAVMIILPLIAIISFLNHP